MAINSLSHIRVGSVLDDGSDYITLDSQDVQWVYQSPGTFWEIHDYVPITRYMMNKLGVKSALKITDDFSYKISDQMLYFRDQSTGIKIDALHVLQNVYLDLSGKELDLSKIL